MRQAIMAALLALVALGFGALAAIPDGATLARYAAFGGTFAALAVLAWLGTADVRNRQQRARRV